jgi:hypothetical protein
MVNNTADAGLLKSTRWLTAGRFAWPYEWTAISWVDRQTTVQAAGS